ncbi:MAG: hypothetical protein IIB88_08025, partial [Chloroflexi bacterium]|nr:hypothetical protein [Chloroflexota bacterium]
TPPATPPAQPQPTFDVRALELALWETVKDSADPADFEDFLAHRVLGDAVQISVEAFGEFHFAADGAHARHTPQHEPHAEDAAECTAE